MTFNLIIFKISIAFYIVIKKKEKSILPIGYTMKLFYNNNDNDSVIMTNQIIRQ